MCLKRSPVRTIRSFTETELISVVFKMFRSCCVPGCERVRKEIKLHRMPSNFDRLFQWMRVLSQVPSATFERMDRKTIAKMYVCHNHFEAKFVTGNMRLINSAFPSLFTLQEIVSGEPSRNYHEIGM